MDRSQLIHRILFAICGILATLFCVFCIISWVTAALIGPKFLIEILIILIVALGITATTLVVINTEH